MNFEDSLAVRTMLSEPQKIVIVPHKNPDGDAIGSSLGLFHYLKSLGQETVVIVPNDYPKFLKWMPGTDDIFNFERHNSQSKKALESATMIFTLDFNHLGRTGQMADYLERSKAYFIMIDHHQKPEKYANITYSDVEMSSTCEMVFNFLEYLEDTDRIDEKIANCLYTGIMTDTGSFKYNTTTSKTHRIVAELIDKGANNTYIHNKVFDTNTPNRLHLLGCALKNMVIVEGYNTAYITLSQEELDLFDHQKGDTEGFVNYGLTLDGICFAVIFIENKEEGIIKISFRSEGNFSVNEFARKHFDGGGHVNAAGGKSDDPMDKTIARFLNHLKEYKKALTR